MSVYIEQNQQYNFSESLSTCRQKNSISIRKPKRMINTWISRSRQRKQLAKLDDRLLKDIGLTRSQAEIEISKPFWK
jgi:uncharacterized protein YjiS (DUF1127 family)